MSLKVAVMKELNKYYRDNPKYSTKRNTRSIWPYSKQSEHNFYRTINRALPYHNFLFLPFVFLYKREHAKIYNKCS